jgi:cyclophilin family peptidyl-prolyl cis-trans isomerase/protein-disulfide isomerase
LATATAVAAPATIEPTATQASLFAPATEADWQIGGSNPRVILIEYGDYQCPYCAEVAPVLAQILEEYPDDVRLVYRHYPLVEIHDKAQLAAEAAEAAGAQGKFWELHELLYATQTAWAASTPEAFRELLNTYAEQIGLDVQQFANALDGGVFRDKVQDAYDAAVSIGLPGTPFLLYNGQPYQGPISHWAFATLIKLARLTDRQYDGAPPDLIDPFNHYTATLRTEKGAVVIQLFADKAPLTVNNFVFLAREGWYDNITFHRVVPGFVVQSGDPSGTGFGGPGYFIPDEINPELKFDAAGWVGMANAGPDTNGSQFFITLAPAAHLDGKYTLFGQVVSGLEVLARLTPRDPAPGEELPLGDTLHSVTIEEK